MEATQQQNRRQRSSMLPSDHHIGNNNKRARTSLSAPSSLGNGMNDMTSFGVQETEDDRNDLLHDSSCIEEPNLNHGEETIYRHDKEIEGDDIVESPTLSQPQTNQDDSKIDDSFGSEVRKERIDTTKKAAAKLQDILGNVKGTTQKLLSEIDSYLKSVESVRIDYMKCRESQNNEARRLEEVEPDVAGATGRFVSMLQQAGGSEQMMRGMMTAASMGGIGVNAGEV